MYHEFQCKIVSNWTKIYKDKMINLCQKSEKTAESFWC